MDSQTPVLAILSEESERDLANSIAAALGYPYANIVIGSPAAAAAILQQHSYTPRYLLIDIGTRAHDVLPEIDQLAEHCEAGTRVVVMGQTNDISFYRELIDRGVNEYFTGRVSVEQLRAVLSASQLQQTGDGKVIAFAGSGASDGCSTLAINTAYALAATHKKPTVLVDLDYQFGMVAKQLDLAPPYGIKEIFEHPERGIDDVLVNRMTVRYRNTLDVIGSPVPLHFLPTIPPEIIRDLIGSLQRKYSYVVLDLPHLWSPWTSAALSSSHHVVLVSQLWLKSITHAARLLAAWQRAGIDQKHLVTVVNRSGSKFKEAINARDFERVCGRRIDIYVPNDIKTVVRAENEGMTIMELGNTLVANEIQRLCERILSHDQAAQPAVSAAARKL